MSGLQRPEYLQPDEELLLIVRSKAGDQWATLRLVESLRGLVCRLANRWLPQVGALDRDDLVSYGLLGLLRAIERFDVARLNPDTGKPLRLSTYAHSRITREIAKAVNREMFMISPPRDSYVSPHAVVSLNEPAPASAGDEPASFMEVIPDPREFENEVMHQQWLTSMFAQMPNPEWPKLVTLRFGLEDDTPLTYNQIGEATGLMPWMASYQTRRAVRWLRNQLPS